jgi:hypothetical protein
MKNEVCIKLLKSSLAVISTTLAYPAFAELVSYLINFQTTYIIILSHKMHFCQEKSPPPHFFTGIV